MSQLTALEWAGVAVLIVAYVALLLWLRRRARRDPNFTEFQLHGPAVPDEFNRVFGAYGQGGVESILVLMDGIHVGYHDGSHMRFMPVPTDSTVYWDSDGQLKVAPPERADG